MAFKGEYQRNQNFFPPFQRVPGKYSPSVKQHKQLLKKLSSPRNLLESEERVESSDEWEIETVREADNSEKEFARNSRFQLDSPIRVKKPNQKIRCNRLLSGGETKLPELYWPPNSSSKENQLSEDTDWKTVSSDDFENVLCSTPILPSAFAEKPHFSNTELGNLSPILSTSVVPGDPTLKNASTVLRSTPTVQNILTEKPNYPDIQASAVKPLHPCLPRDVESCAKKTSDVEADQVSVPMEIDLFIHTQTVSNQIITLSKTQGGAAHADITVVHRSLRTKILSENSTAGQKINLEISSLPPKLVDNECLHKNLDQKYSREVAALQTNENVQQEKTLIENSIQEKSLNQNSQQESTNGNSLQEESLNENSSLEKSTSGEPLHQPSLNNDNSLLNDSIHLKSTNCANTKSSDVLRGSHLHPIPEIREKPSSLNIPRQELSTIPRIAKPKVKRRSKIPKCNLANLARLRKGPDFFLGDRVNLKRSLIQKISNCKLHDLPLVKRTI